ncbi:MAG: hypothetical protein IT384_19690 [Deltaproteobacteria bacterium]|nr:hypothetical protein [Deltaproteobacteria bacterium]
MSDPRFRGGGPPVPKSKRREADADVGEALDILVASIKELMQKPKEEREAHIQALRAHVSSELARFEAVDKDGPSTKRLRALESILATVAGVSARR